MLTLLVFNDFVIFQKLSWKKHIITKVLVTNKTNSYDYILASK
jgi:hypothetical protein